MDLKDFSTLTVAQNITFMADGIVKMIKSKAVSKADLNPASMIKYGVNSLIKAENHSLSILSVNECQNILRRFSLGTEIHLEKVVRKFSTYNGYTVEVEDVIQKLRGYAPPSLKAPTLPKLPDNIPESSSEEEIIVVEKPKPK